VRKPFVSVAERYRVPAVVDDPVGHRQKRAGAHLKEVRAYSGNRFTPLRRATRRRSRPDFDDGPRLDASNRKGLSYDRDFLLHDAKEEEKTKCLATS
jgi:hypothetical protein